MPDHRAELQLHCEKPMKLNSGPMIMSTYQDVQIFKADDGHCFTIGRLFATEADARFRSIEVGIHGAMISVYSSFWRVLSTLQTCER